MNLDIDISESGVDTLHARIDRAMPSLPDSKKEWLRPRIREALGSQNAEYLQSILHEIEVQVKRSAGQTTH